MNPRWDNNNASRFLVETKFLPKFDLRVLIVADGRIRFNSSGLGLSIFSEALKESEFLWENINITTAHRTSDYAGATFPNFRFDDASRPFGIDSYDQLWLFGDDRENADSQLSPTELHIISKFMNAGGGVFATGDHEDLGAALCSKLPRVRSMRKWSVKPGTVGGLRAPYRNGPSRIDTLRIGQSAGYNENDQTDGTPQQICPKFFLDDSGRYAFPHPLLSTGDGFAITILPDHMHEGECILPDSLQNTYEFDGNEPQFEYPPMIKPPTRLSPVVVAIGTSASGLVNLDENPPVFPVEPRSFTIITAYDGHYVDDFSTGMRTKLGRVVVDASFHHFVNLNLDGFQKDAKPEFEIIKKYYRNLLTWLVPAKLQSNYCLSLLLALRYSPELIEELDHASEFRWSNIVDVGTYASGMIIKAFSTPEVRMYAIQLAGLLPDNIGNIVTDYLDPWFPRVDPNNRRRVLLDSTLIPTVLIGSSILGIAARFPAEESEAAELLSNDQTLLQTAVTEGLAQGLLTFKRVLRESNSVLSEVEDVLSKIKL